MKPVIGIPQMGSDLFRIYMKSKYVASIKRAGGQVRWIELEDPEVAVAELISCDGLLLPGGSDIDPRLYGQEPTEKCGKPHLLRDAAEPKMLAAFLDTGKPVFCICRGIQLLNVALGGTLYQDISTTQKQNHAHFPSRASGCHPIKLKPGTRLSRILGTADMRVNSMHHQAADCIASALIVSAVSDDGFVEALELPKHAFCIGVQWHPEHMSKNHPAQQRLFDAFVAACKK